MAIQPNCFLVGAMKAGTTAIAKALSMHDNIFVPSLKEPNYHTILSFKQESKIDYSSYVALYRQAQYTSIDASTWYLYDPDSAKLIYKYNPAARIIAVLRNPAERAFSHWQYLSRDLRCPHPSFKDAVRQEIQMIESDDWISPYPYVAMGLYAFHLQRFYNLFPREQIRIYLYDDLRSNPEDLLKDIQSFLGLQVQDLSILPGVNVSGTPNSRILHNLFNRPNPVRRLLKNFLPSAQIRSKIIQRVNHRNLKRQVMPNDIENELMSFYEDDINDLEKLTGRPLSCWKRP